MIECKLTGGQHVAAILAGIAVAQQDILPREGASLVGDAAVLQQPDHRGHGDATALSVEHKAVLLLGARNAFEHQHQGAPRAAYINRLIGGVEH